MNHEIIPEVTNAPEQNCAECHGAVKTKQASFQLISSAFERHPMLNSERCRYFIKPTVKDHSASEDRVLAMTINL